jgi:DNA-binding NarL/FixJ family response regulator
VNDEIRVLVVDDHALLRTTLVERLRREPGLSVVGTANNADQAIERVMECVPDIILLDVDMPGLSSFEAARTIAWMRPESRIIFVSGFFHDRYIEQALEVKARGYVTKIEPPETIIEAVREVAAGGVYFSGDVRSRIVIEPGGTRLAEEATSRASTLTVRELEVLRYIARGLSKKEIANIMHISVKTVDRHSANLMTKLAIHDRVELARFAIREGLAEA